MRRRLAWVLGLAGVAAALSCRTNQYLSDAQCLACPSGYYSPGGSSANCAKDISMKQFPLVEAHDAATIYVPSDYKKNAGAVRTQCGPAGTSTTGTLATLLDCGARSLDLRLEQPISGSTLKFQHGLVSIDVAVPQALSDVSKWAAVNRGAMDLVLLVFSHCRRQGDPAGITTKKTKCNAELESELQKAGILSMPAVTVAGFTYGTLFDLVLAGTNKSIVGIVDGYDMNDNFDPDITCKLKSGIHLTGDCIAPTSSPLHQPPFTNLYNYLSKQAPGTGIPEYQALWQASGVVDVIPDVVTSGVNQWLQQYYLNWGQTKGGIWRMDAICYDGTGIESSANLRASVVYPKPSR